MISRSILLFRMLRISCALLVAAPLFQMLGCVFFCDTAGFLDVRGMLVDADTGAPVAGAAIGGRAFTDGQETDYSAPIIFDGTPNGPVSGDDGTFQEEFWTGLMPCQEPPPEFPRPDRVEIIVVRDGCEQSFFVDINEETAIDVVDPEYYGDVIELIDPILVPPSEEE